jgi:hypothetical protein
MTGFIAMDLINSIYMLSSHTERSVFDRLTNTWSSTSGRNAKGFFESF